MLVPLINIEKGLAVSIAEWYHKNTVVVPGEGHLQVNVEVGIVVFNPWREEVLLGKIKEQSEEGILVDMKFVEAFIPAEVTMPDSYFDQKQGVWVWKYEGYELIYENDTDIRFEVYSTDFSKSKQTLVEEENDVVPMQMDGIANDNGNEQQIEYITKYRYNIIGCWQKDGLGPKAWWDKN